MSNGHARRLPKSIERLALFVAAALIGSFVLGASPSAAKPDHAMHAADTRTLTITQVKVRIDTLDRRAEIASEDLNTVRVHMQDARSRLAALQADLERKRNHVDKLRSLVVGTALSDFQNAGGLSTTTSFLTADNPAEFLNGVASKAMVEHQQTDLLSRLTQQQRSLGIQDQQAQREVAAIDKEHAQAAQHKADLTHRTQQAQNLLDSLKAAQLARLKRMQAAADAAAAQVQASRSAVRTATTVPAPAAGTAPSSTPAPQAGGDVPASSRAQVAVQTALAQLGDPYVYGAAGPDTFDCSGLTMYAWRAAGVALSHSSSVQSTQGTSVSLSALMPGDLVFYYSPVSHVGMYIGNGQVVHAPHTGSSVEVVPLNSMPVNHAQRVG